MADEPDTTTQEPTTETAALETPAAEPSVDAAVDGTVLGGEEAPAAPEDGASPESVVPETYELTAPDGVTLDPAALEIATPVFKELGLSNEQASKLVPVAAQWREAITSEIQQAAVSQHAALSAGWVTEARADAEIGGANWDASTAAAAKALDMFGAPKGSALRQILNETGLGNNPEMIRVFARIGKAVSEDGFIPGGAKTPKTIEEKFYGTKA